jgi:error-prone DNA polymerase
MAAAQTLQPLFKRPVPDTPEYQTRLRSELALIDKFHFVKVFHQVQRIVVLMEQLDIPHIIRGSSGSSLVCYLLGITEIDPIVNGLHLARFMNYGRTDIPDIDIDVPYNRRTELYKAISETWPSECARISNHVSYGRKMALREVASEVVRDSEAPEKQKQLKALRRKHFKLETILPEESVRTSVQQKAKALVGTTRYDSLHCGGIVIFEEEGEVPEDLISKRETSSYMVQIKLDKDETEDAGFIKIDILSNRGLAQLRDCQLASGGRVRTLLDYPVPDEKVLQIFRSGETLGLTFGESRGMRKIFMKMVPKSLEEVAIALALIRPAAAGDGRKAEFLDAWTKRREAGDPRLRPIVFDDDAIARIQLLLGCSAAEADYWRKVFAKGRKDEIQRFRITLHLKGIPQEVVVRTVSDLEQLVHYSFCKSHAISYAQLVWALAWEKAHRPHQFWVGTLNHCHSMYRRWVHWREARCAGVELPTEKGQGPWKLEGRRMVPVSSVAPVKGLRQSTLDSWGIQAATPSQGPQGLDEYRTLGYWRSKEFLQGSYFRLEGNTAHFCGLIATARILRKDRPCTLITLGCDNKVYIDLVIAGHARGDLLHYAVLEGYGQMYGDSIQVAKIRGIPLSQLNSSPK